MALDIIESVSVVLFFLPIFLKLKIAVIEAKSAEMTCKIKWATTQSGFFPARNAPPTAAPELRFC